MWQWIKCMIGMTKGMEAGRALSIGINPYPAAELHGCHNDAEDMLAAFPDCEKRIVLGADATRRGIMDALSWLSKSPEGTVSFLHYSGHGIELAGHQGICPVDFNWGDMNGVMDSDLVEALGGTKSRLFWTSDSCHSGDLQRGPWACRTFPGSPYWIRRSVIPLCRGGMTKQINCGFISACQHDQVAIDTVDESGRPCGAFTNSLLKALKGRSECDTTNGMKDAVASHLRSKGFAQRPVCDGPLKDAVFWR